MRTISRLFQVLLAVVGWVIFGWLWWTALQAGPSYSQLRATIIVGVIDVGIILVTMVWVRWNIRIHRKKGPRRAVPVVDFAYDHDSAGVPVVGATHPENTSRSFLIDMEGEGEDRTKVYRSAPMISPEAV